MDEKLKIVDAKDCAPGQMVASWPVTEESPDPDDWRGIDLGDCEKPGLYRAVTLENCCAPDAGEVLQEVLDRHHVDSECWDVFIDSVPKEDIQRLQAALESCMKHLTYYLEDNFLVRVT